METDIFSNGVQLRVEQSDVKMFYIDILIRNGAVYEDKSNSGISHFIEHMLFKGTKTRSSKELLDSLKSIGVQVDAATSQTYTSLRASCLEKDFYHLLYDLSDMIINPAFIPQDVKKEAKVILEEYYADLDDLDDIIYTKMYKEAYRKGKRKNMVLGTVSSIKSMSAKRLREFHSKYYVGSNIYISVISSLPINTVREYVWACFNKLPKGEPAIQPKSEFSGKMVKILNGGNSTSVAYLSFAAPPQSVFTFEDSMLCDILDKRLHNEIREKRGLAYIVDVSLDQDQVDGMLTFNVSASPKNIRQCIELFAQEAKDLQTNFCTLQELEEGKNKAILSITEVMDEPRKRCGFNCMQLFLYGRVYFFETMIEAISQVSMQDVLLSAQRILGSECLYLFCGEKHHVIPHEDICMMLKN